VPASHGAQGFRRVLDLQLRRGSRCRPVCPIQAVWERPWIPPGCKERGRLDTYHASSVGDLQRAMYSLDSRGGWPRWGFRLRKRGCPLRLFGGDRHDPVPLAAAGCLREALAKVGWVGVVGVRAPVEVRCQSGLSGRRPRAALLGAIPGGQLGGLDQRRTSDHDLAHPCQRTASLGRIESIAIL
jgi:hypothetical protein